MNEPTRDGTGEQLKLPDFAAIRAAAERIRPHVHRTPVMTSASLDRMAGASLYFKCENLQKVGAFKYRGATNAVQSLTAEQASRGVATHSSGNHAAALALAAAARGCPAYVVMPTSAPPVKRAAVAGYGARIVDCAPTLAARESTLAEVVAETGAHFVHPYNDPRVIAGQGTAALELLEEVPDLDAILAPVGGGGLMSGTAIAAQALRPGIRVLGAEPEGADDAHRSLAAGRILPSEAPRTVCDGLLTSLGELTFAILGRRLEAIVTVSDEAIIAALRHLMERAKLVVEPSGAVPLGAVLEGKVDLGGLRVGLILSGGNLDLDRLPFGALPK
ncbi:MAG: pyridoxal-phosphate dependent enzyme [Polyangia bacterium]|jgi:threonine dehydratase|nr:pyridoxal-phosphate dependent enzyme [Polyangia bacterium]